jgi:hypothetical protein
VRKAPELATQPLVSIIAQRHVDYFYTAVRSIKDAILLEHSTWCAQVLYPNCDTVLLLLVQSERALSHHITQM